MEKLEEILRNYLNKGSDRIDVTMVLSLIDQFKKDDNKQLHQYNVSGRSEQLCECKKHSIKTNYGFEICTKCGNEFDD